MKYHFLLYTAILLSSFGFGQKNPCNPEGKPYSQMPGDTTIVLSSGTMLTFNRCEFFDVRDCIQIVEITDPEQLRQQNINMYDDDGNILVTCGMVMINMKDCGKECFEIPVRIRIRVSFPDCFGQGGEIPNLYYNAGGGWSMPKKEDAKVTTYNNIRYLELTTACPIKFINCDVPKRGRKVKFVAPKEKKVSNIRLGITCPLFYYGEKLVEPRRKVKVQLLCTNPKLIIVKSAVIGTNGDTVFTKGDTLASLKHGNGKVGCRNRKKTFFGNIFGWLGRKSGSFYRKYYL